MVVDSDMSTVETSESNALECVGCSTDGEGSGLTEVKKVEGHPRRLSLRFVLWVLILCLLRVRRCVVWLMMVSLFLLAVHRLRLVVLLRISRIMFGVSGVVV